MPHDFILYFAMALVAGALGFIVWWAARSPWRLPKSGNPGEGTKRGWMLDFSRTIGSVILSQFPRQLDALRQRDQAKLEKAGLYPTWDFEELLGMQVVGAFYGMVMTGYLLSGQWLWIAVGAGFGAWLPRWYVANTKDERQLQLLREFPTAIDMIMLGLEGGLDITAGIKEMIENSQEGPLRTEFQRLYQDIAMGVSRTDAFRKLIHRIDSMEIRATIMSMVQAMEMGAEIGPLMRVQAEQLRFNRLTRAEEAANKAPTKMMLPMALFILPCMFIVIFAPIVISLMQSTSGIGP